MKKSLIALAALAAVGAASAQSSVSIYGRMDLGYTNSSQTNDFGTANSSATSFTSQKSTASSFGNQNGRSTSRLGFTGVEDLGGGLRASFNYEVALAPDNIGHKVGTGDATPDESARVGFGITRLANLGLSGGFGTVTLGTFLNAHDALRGYSYHTFNQAGGDFLARHSANQADTGSPGATFLAAATSFVGNATLFDGGLAANATATGSGTLSLSELQAAQYIKGINGIGLNGRSSNSVAYRSPTIAGFNLGLGLVADKGNRTGAQASNTRDVKGQTVSLSYAQGPIRAMAVYGSAKNVDKDQAGALSSGPAYLDQKVTDQGFAVNYNFGAFEAYAVHERVKANVNGGLLDGTVGKTSATEVGVKVPMGAFTPYALVGRGKINMTLDETISFKTRAYQVGTTYDLSKRTSIYAAYGKDQMKIEGAGLKRSAASVGVLHLF